MAVEIERKFIASGEFPKTIKFEIQQGYLLNTPEKVVRIRTKDQLAYITVKITVSDMSKLEYEYLIPFNDALELLSQCDSKLEKTRYIIDRWEVDVFHGHNEGLILAEIELTDENEKIELPDFIIKEVTGDSRYYNNELSYNKVLV